MLKLETTFDSHFMPMRLGRAAHDTLQEFIDIDVSAEDLTRILNRNQVYRDLFHKFVTQKAPKQKADGSEPSSGTHRLINLLGMIGSRNLMISARMHKVATGKLPISDDGTVQIVARDYVKLASDYEELFQRNKLDYSETAFAAACYYDWFRVVFAEHKNFKPNEAFFADTWRKASRQGLVCYHLANKVKGLNPKFGMAAGTLLHCGRLHMMLRFGESKGGYTDYVRALDEGKKIPILARLLNEKEKFKSVHEDWGSYSLRFFNVFSPLCPAIRFYREPYRLKGNDRNSYLLAVALGLAENMANSWKIPADEKDPVFQEWSTPWSKELKLKPGQIIEVIKAAMTAN